MRDEIGGSAEIVLEASGVALSPLENVAYCVDVRVAVEVTNALDNTFTDAS